jgi:hypothetical protein
MGTTIRFTVFNSEHTANAIQGWRAKAAKKKEAKEHKAFHRRISHKLGGIVGLNKYKDEQGHVTDIELPPHHKLNHDGEHQHHAHPQHHAQHAHPHPHQDGETHNVEIHQTPLFITNKNPNQPKASDSKDTNKEQSSQQQAPPKTSAFANLAKLAAAKEKEKDKGRDPESNGAP